MVFAFVTSAAIGVFSLLIARYDGSGSNSFLDFSSVEKKAYLFLTLLLEYSADFFLELSFSFLAFPYYARIVRPLE